MCTGNGIAGPLTLMSTALRRGITVSGQAAAIDRICAELDRWRCGTAGRTWWPGMISPAEWKTRAIQQPGPQRPSWCYGTPGLARAQQLAALLPHLNTRFAQRLHRHRPPTCDGLLDGAAGVELTRHTTADVLSASRWDACLLITSPILEQPQTQGV